MKKSFFLLLALLGCLGTKAQSLPKDSLYFVRLQNGTTLYSNKVKLMNSFTRGKYLLLDGDRHIPLSDAKDFKGWEGTFAVANIDGEYDVYKLQNEGRRISLYSKCYYTTETIFGATTPDGIVTPTTITTHQKAFFFRKGVDSPIQRLTVQNLKVATADNPASTRQLKVAGTYIHVGVGLIAGGIALTTLGIISTVNHNHTLTNAYDQASANWCKEAQINPNTPLPALPHYSSLGPAFYLGAAMTLSAMIPLFNVRNHVQKALDIYNGID
jgi:hypothetical protein